MLGTQKSLPNSERSNYAVWSASVKADQGLEREAIRKALDLPVESVRDITVHKGSGLGGLIGALGLGVAGGGVGAVGLAGMLGMLGSDPVPAPLVDPVPVVQPVEPATYEYILEIDADGVQVESGK
jgi:hypothetical protein